MAVDYAKARHYFEQVLTTSGASDFAMGNAKCMLGQCYSRGQGVSKDLTRAEQLLREAKPSTPGVGSDAKRVAQERLS